ncbi:MAG: AAA family ATPase [Candidatus Paceibacterota bacterium]|jgi:ATP-dependent Clp protease ATP-binding subunit ClpA
MQSYISAGLKSWWNVFKFILYFFSIKTLFKTLLSGWERDSSDGHEWWERLILGAIFIVFGFIFRIVVIIIGLIALTLSIVLLPVLLIIPIRFSYERLVRIGAIGKSWSYGQSLTLHRSGIALYKGGDKKLYGREELVEHMTRILCREDKDNLLMVGAPGAGKRTVLSQFAKDVYRGLVPASLQNREMIEIPLSEMPVTTLRKIFAEAQKAGNIIVVFSEPEKYPGMLEEIVPLLKAYELQVIVITSLDGYVQSWKDREDVLRYLERIDVLPLDDAKTLEFLTDHVKDNYRDVSFEDGVLEEIIRRTNELIQTKLQPEKSLDLLTELVVNVKSVTIKDVDRVLSQKTGVPLGAIERDEKQVLLALEDVLSTEIVGQKEAIRDVASALRRARTGVASKGKPVGSFLFLGPTGSGKTHTARMLARHYFGGDGVMTRFDMSEFALPVSETAFVERLALAIEENPFGLLFFDELEKADKIILNTLLQVLDEGRLTTRVGRTVSCKNSIIIATSNAGTAFIEEHQDTTKDSITHFLIDTQLFSPEFLNRFDDIVLFKPLTNEDAHAVTRLLLEDLNKRLSQERGVTVEITDTLVHGLVDAGFDHANGARALRRVMQDIVENKVADAILHDKAAPGSRIIIG